MFDLDATFEIVRQRQSDLRLLAGPQPLVPFPEPPFDPVRRLAGRAMTRLGTWLAGAPGRQTPDAGAAA